MSDSNELCAAAARIAQYGKLVCDQLYRDAILLACYVLHNVRPDDDQRISSTLLHSMFHDGGKDSFFMPGACRNFCVQLNCGAWEVLTETDEGYARICDVETLGQLRALIGALGIKKKYEQPNAD